MTWQPTWRRLVAATLVCFMLVLALLAWRLQSGQDPALGSTATATPHAQDPDRPGATVPDPGGFLPDPGAGAGAPPSQDSSGAPSMPSTHAS